jgi:hypothetical protein
MVKAVIATWTTATIARILALHTCPARCRARRRCRTAKLKSAPCLPLDSSKPTTRHSARQSVCGRLVERQNISCDDGTLTEETDGDATDGCRVSAAVGQSRRAV